MSTFRTPSHGDGWHLSNADCLVALRAMADNSVDAIVTDPPAGISFMGNDWDDDKGGRDQWVAWLTEVKAECLRVLKPGGQAFTWALPRTSHWTATAVENAGFEIRDVHHHIFGTGFPKSLNVSSVMHELLGVTDGEYGTALKPAVEHWILARKPLDGTYRQNILAHGTGALNIGAARIDGAGNATRVRVAGDRSRDEYRMGTTAGGPIPTNIGRWPAHLSLDEYAAALLDEQAGERVSGGRRGLGGVELGYKGGASGYEVDPISSSTGGASRFFYVAKAPRAEKDRGLEGTRRRSGGEATGRKDGSAGTKNARAGSGRTGNVRNIHPTVKSIELMRWLVRLITPPGGLVLDPFTGSGTTGIAAIEEGCRFVGVELGPDYFDIATARLRGATKQQRLFAPATPTTETPEPQQLDLLAGAR